MYVPRWASSLLPTGSLLCVVLAGDGRSGCCSSLFRVPRAQLTLVNPTVLGAGPPAVFRGSCKSTALCFRGTSVRPGEAEGEEVILLGFESPVVCVDCWDSQFLSHPGLQLRGDLGVAVQSCSLEKEQSFCGVCDSLARAEAEHPGGCRHSLVLARLFQQPLPPSAGNGDRGFQTLLQSLPLCSTPGGAEIAGGSIGVA